MSRFKVTPKEYKNFEIQVQTEVNDLLLEFGLKDEVLEEEITNKIVTEYCKMKGIEVER